MLTIENHNLENDKNTIETLKKSQLPLYMWGGGNAAGEVYDVLLKNGITLSGVFVDAEYHPDKDFRGLPVTTVKEILSKNDKINVIMGHAQYHKKQEMAEKPGVCGVYYILNPFKTHDDISYQDYLVYKKEYDKAYDLFEEAYSRDVFQAYLNTRINGNLQYLLEQFKKPMTFFENDVYTLSSAENYVDIGAYNGDTIAAFLKSVNGKYSHIDAFEPDSSLFSELKNYVQTHAYTNCELYQAGCWNSNTILSFESDCGQSDHVVSGESKGNNTIRVVTLDSVLKGKDVTFIKGSLSSGTIEWIEGAKEILSEQKPKLAITLGITKDLLYVVPQLLHSINKDYKLYLRFIESMPSRLTLYAK